MEIVMLGVLAAILAAVVWVGLSVRRLPEKMDAAAAEQHRAVLNDLREGLATHSSRQITAAQESTDRLRAAISQELNLNRDALQAGTLLMQSKLDEARGVMLEHTLKTLSEHARADRELLQSGLAAASQQLSLSIQSLTQSVNERLEMISGHVNTRLDEGFKKTNDTFANVMARLATIDEAQKKIDGLTTNVVSLQQLLGDKKSRGAFGEVQLEALVRNTLPPSGYEFQVTLPNGNRADCMLKLPAPTGDVVVDSKFPLENYHRMFEDGIKEPERLSAQTAFRGDLKKHIDAISGKYLIPGVTSDGAVMFVPAEAVFAEIHAYHPEVVNYAQQKRVWIVSPTTLMAVLNTARAVLKDVETRKQIHLIKDALGKLSKDFVRWDERMAALARHIEQASKDVQDVHTSSRKIFNHFTRIEEVQLTSEGEAPLPQISASA
jgi:DNA recombination protein RmuC